MRSESCAFTQTMSLVSAIAAMLMFGACDSSSATRPGAASGLRADQLSASATIVVTGTGNPATDVAAVQAAVDQGGRVVLKGHFSFNQSPAVANPVADYPLATVLVSRAVTITGASDESDDSAMATIDGGTIPFLVEAPGASVSIQHLRFAKPTSDAVLVAAASGISIASNTVAGVVPWQSYGAGFEINTSGNPPTPSVPCLLYTSDAADE